MTLSNSLRIDMNSTSTNAELVEALTKLQRYPATSEKIFMETVKDITKVLKADVISRTKVFTGATKKSISTSVRINTLGNIVGKVYPKKEAKETLIRMQTGRRPGKLPPTEKLRAWVAEKWYAYGEIDIKQAAFRLAKSISQSGTIGEDIVKTVKDRRAPWINSVINVAVDKLLRSLNLK